MPTEQSLRQFAQLAAIGIVVVGSYQVLLPFIPAILFAVVVCVSTWPLYEWLCRVMQGITTLAVLAMVLVIVPSASLAVRLTDNVTTIVEATRTLLNRGPITAPLSDSSTRATWDGLFS